MQVLRDYKIAIRWKIADIKGYLDKLISKFELKDAKPAKVPIATHFQILAKLCPKTEEEKRYMEKVPYSNVVG